MPTCRHPVQRMRRRHADTRRATRRRPAASRGAGERFPNPLPAAVRGSGPSPAGFWAAAPAPLTTVAVRERRPSLLAQPAPCTAPPRGPWRTARRPAGPPMPPACCCGVRPRDRPILSRWPTRFPRAHPAPNPPRPGSPVPVRPGEGRPAPDWQPRRARRGTPALRLAANRVPRAEARGSPSRDRVPRRVGGPSPDRNPVPPLRATVSLAFDEPLPAGDRPRTRPHRDASPRPAPDGRPRCAPDPRPPCRRGRVAPDATPAGRPSCLRWTAPVPRRMIAPRGGFQPPPRLVLAGPRSGFQPPTRPRRRPGFASALPSAPVSSTQPPCARTPVQPARPGPAASAVLHTRPWPRHIVG